jgi:hypothetical protein
MDCAIITEEIIKRLEGYAKWDTITSEFSHEGHICWQAAQELKRLLAAQGALQATIDRQGDTIEWQAAYIVSLGGKCR